MSGYVRPAGEMTHTVTVYTGPARLRRFVRMARKRTVRAWAFSRESHSWKWDAYPIPAVLADDGWDDGPTFRERCDALGIVVAR